MAVAGRSTGAEGVASTLREAGFARLLVAADADALAAAGLLANALAQRGVPFQASVHAERPGVETADDTTTIRIGIEGSADCSLDASERPASETAFAAARALEADPDPLLALAGRFVVGDETGDLDGSDAFETATERDLVERRPGVAVPVADLDDGLAHSTLVHTDFSGDPDATATALAGCDDDGRRTASMVALSTCADATPRGASALGCALNPYVVTERGREATTVSGRFETVGGLADVLCAVAHERPGIALALALGHDVRETALDAWRSHADRAHRALREATTERHRNVFVARTDAGASLPTAARLLCDFRSPESIAVVVDDGRAAGAAHDDADLGDRMAEAATAAGGDGAGDDQRAWARFSDADGFVTAFREAVA